MGQSDPIIVKVDVCYMIIFLALPLGLELSSRDLSHKQLTSITLPFPPLFHLNRGSCSYGPPKLYV